MNIIIEAIKETFPKVNTESLTGETHFADISGWDSMSSVTLQVELESRLGIGQLDFVITGDMTIQSLADRIK